MKGNQQDLKKILKPLVKQCIREVLFEEGVLSTLISEVVKGTKSVSPIVEQKQSRQQLEEQKNIASSKKRQQLLERRKKMLDAVGRDSYNGVNVFEGTTPMRSAGSTTATANSQGALSGIDPSDPGVDISSLMGASHAWKRIIGN